MGRTEIRTFEYRCDGWLVDGRRCITERRIEAPTLEAADDTMRTKQVFSVIDPWIWDHRGWICTRDDHRT